MNFNSYDLTDEQRCILTDLVASAMGRVYEDLDYTPREVTVAVEKLQRILDILDNK